MENEWRDKILEYLKSAQKYGNNYTMVSADELKVLVGIERKNRPGALKIGEIMRGLGYRQGTCKGKFGWINSKTRFEKRNFF